MKKNLGVISLVWILSSFVLFVACGDDRPSSPKVALPSEVADMDELNEFVCSMSIIGEKVFVNNEGKNYECDGDHWFVSFDQPKSSSSKKNSEQLSSSWEPCKTCEFGTLKDSRDGQTYKTVKIGEQWWMAENMNFETNKSYCYNDTLSYCKKYGRAYSRDAALVVCPAGWHLPTSEEFDTLISTVGGSSRGGYILKSHSGWYRNSNGIDSVGFSALPAGRVNESSYPSGMKGSSIEERSDLIGEFAIFCSSTIKEGWAQYFEMSYYNDMAGVGGRGAITGCSVRCLKNEGDEDSLSNVALNVVEGTLSDSRDGQNYRTVSIGEQTWMAENLNFKTENSYCYNDNISNCKKYGRLYTWATVMDSAGGYNPENFGCKSGYFCSPAENLRGICPEGWHLPRDREWITLFDAVGGVLSAGYMLKSTYGWNERSFKQSGNGSDAYLFSILPAGEKNTDGEYEFEGILTRFWLPFELVGSENARYVMMHHNNVGVIIDYLDKNTGLSVRCIKD